MKSYNTICNICNSLLSLNYKHNIKTENDDHQFKIGNINHFKKNYLIFNFNGFLVILILCFQSILFACEPSKTVANKPNIIGKSNDYDSLFKSYTIPIVDISQSIKHQVVVDSEEGQYLGHPTTVLLRDNKTMYAVYPKGHASGALVIKCSDDAGLTWSPRLPVPENWASSMNPPAIDRLTAPDGKERLIILTGSVENKMEDMPVRSALSEDQGKTWTPLLPIGVGKDYNAIVVASSLIRLRDGRYMAIHHSDYLPGEDGKRNMKLYKMLSSDGGLTWGPRIFVSDHPEAEFCEPGAFRSPDGKQIAVLIRDNSRKYHSFLIFSDNEGDTWTVPHEVGGTLTGDRHVAQYAPDGRLVIVFRDMDVNSPTRYHFVAWVGTYNDIVTGAPGQYRIKLLHSYYGGDCGYAGLEVLPDGTFIATTYISYRPNQKNSIISVRFQLKDTDTLLNKLNQP